MFRAYVLLNDKIQILRKGRIILLILVKVRELTMRNILISTIKLTLN